MALLDKPGTNPIANPAGTAGSTGLVNTALNIVDPKGIRKQISGLFDGGISSLWDRYTSPGINIPKQLGGTNLDPTNTGLKKDWRVRVGLMHWTDDSKNIMMAPLIGTDKSVVFPYTPNITVTHNARYQEQALTHSNYKNYFYEGSDVAAINIVGDFTVQNHQEALYLLAVIYFFRTCTKMSFGKDPSAGQPPPILALDGYGDFYFPHVSCVLTSFQHTMPADVDYLEIKHAISSSGGQQIARLPTISQINITLQPIYSRNNIAKNMSLTEFSRGNLLRGKGGFL